MVVTILVFGLSLLLFCTFIYLISDLWFRGKRSFSLKIFSALGLLYSFWVLFNGINILLNAEQRAVIYPYIIQTIVCIVPPVLLTYILQFTESKMAKYKWLLRVLFVLTVLDILVVWTNPLHREFVVGYDGLTPLGGKLMPVHMVIAYVPIVFAIVKLTVYIVRNIRANRSLVLVSVGISLPVVLNILYSFGLLDIGFDLTPFAFVFMFGSFAAYSIRTRLFDMKETAAAELFETISDALVIVDRAGIITGVNPAFFNAFPGKKIVPDQTTARELADYLQALSEKQNPPDLFDKIVSGDDDGGILNAEITISVIGEARHYFVSKDMIDDRGHFAGYILTLVDVSNYRRMIDMITELKDRADSASNAKGLFLANMSHEIRTPMNAIIGMVSIGKAAADKERKDYCFGKIENASNHLLGVINDILDISKIEAGKFEIAEAPFRFALMIQGIVNIITFRANEKGLTLKVFIDPQIPVTLLGDDQRLSQVIMNLLGNAVKFTPEGGTIGIQAEMLNEVNGSCAIQVAITDNGIGISEAQQAKLFVSFQQAESGTARRFGGTGLGLTISKNIIEMMNGRIWVESEPGKGSRFVFTVRLQRADAADDVSDSGEAVDVHPSDIGNRFKGCRILLAEDIDINREIILALLEPASITIDIAENGAEAVRLFSEAPERYNMIFMDVQMPEMDGYEATRHIRAFDHPAAASVPIVAMTANVFVEDVAKAIASGMNDHVAKPIDFDVLWHKMNIYMKAAED